MADPPGVLEREPAVLQECLSVMLGALGRAVGFAEGVVMSFDPDVLLPNARQAATGSTAPDVMAPTARRAHGTGLEQVSQ